jgi:hypothetical protein
MWGAMSSGAGLAISLFSLLGHDHPPLGVFGVLGVLLVFFGVLAAKTDNFYIFDVEQRAVFFNRQILSHHTVAPLLDFDRISGFAVNAKEQSTKQRSWWDYWVVMIRDDGKQIRLTDGLEEGLISANALARGLAEHAGCDYWQGRHGSPIRVRVDSAQGVQVTHGRSYTTAIVLGVAVVAGLIVVALAAVL